MSAKKFLDWLKASKDSAVVFCGTFVIPWCFFFCRFPQILRGKNAQLTGEL